MSYEDRYSVVSEVEFDGKIVKLKKPVYVENLETVVDVTKAVLKDPYYAFKLIEMLNKDVSTDGIFYADPSFITASVDPTNIRILSDK